MKKRIKKHMVTFPITARDVSIIYRQESPGAPEPDRELCEVCAERANEVYYAIIEERFVFWSTALIKNITERWGRVGAKLFEKWEDRATEAAYVFMDEQEAAME